MPRVISMNEQRLRLFLATATALARLFWLMAGCLAGGLLAAASPSTPCQYFGVASTTRGDRIVKSTCPPPTSKGAYYFRLDLDPGSGSGVLAGAALVSPADATCVADKCSASAGPGYDLYVAKGCLPHPAAWGLDSAVSTGLSTRKPLSLKSGSTTRFYIAAVQREDTATGDARCSMAIYPGHLTGVGGGRVCSFIDYNPNATITTSTITTTIEVRTLNTSANRTQVKKTSQQKIRSSINAAKEDRTVVDVSNHTVCDNASTPHLGCLTTITTTTVHTATVLSQAPESVEPCKPKAPPIPPQYLAATIVGSSISAAMCLWCIRSCEQRRARRRLAAASEEDFRHALKERSVSQDLAIEDNAFLVDDVLTVRGQRNDNISTLRAVATDHTVPGQSSPKGGVRDVGWGMG